MTAIDEVAPQGVNVVSFLRAPQADDYTREERHALQELLPHIRNGLRIQRELDAFRARVACLETALDQLAPGVLLLDAEGRVIYANAAAEAAFRRSAEIGLLGERCAPGVRSCLLPVSILSCWQERKARPRLGPGAAYTRPTFASGWFVFASLRDYGHDHGHLCGDVLLKTVQASEFKANCLKIMEEVAQSGEGLVVTKNGKPMVTVQPVQRIPESLFGAHASCVHLQDDTIEPLDEAWNAAS
ncbi:MAG: type II toxin-antitoxin system Phd/YefM family antitoxin [Gammaproteobacteria bacterium]